MGEPTHTDLELCGNIQCEKIGVYEELHFKYVDILHCI